MNPWRGRLLIQLIESEVWRDQHTPRASLVEATAQTLGDWFSNLFTYRKGIENRKCRSRPDALPFTSKLNQNAAKDANSNPKTLGVVCAPLS